MIGLESSGVGSVDGVELLIESLLLLWGGCDVGLYDVLLVDLLEQVEIHQQLLF